MPATGGGRAVHTTAAANSKRGEKSRSVESVQQGPAGATAQRPGIKGRAYSTPIVPKGQGNGTADDNASLYSQDGEEIANDAFFQRYHFSEAGGSTKEEVPESFGNSSSDTEGPLSPTHMLSRQPAGDVPSEPSSGVCCFFAPRLYDI
jgi:hypothetical protein